MAELTHIDEHGKARMVDVSGKAATRREAVASATVHMRPETVSAIAANALKKGDALATARIAGIMAAKRVDDLIPLCHSLPISEVRIEFTVADSSVAIEAFAATVAQTGVEMEALTAASIAALTIYDMAKAIDRQMTIEGVRLISKTGGKSGDYFWNPSESQS